MTQIENESCGYGEKYKKKFKDTFFKIISHFERKEFSKVNGLFLFKNKSKQQNQNQSSFLPSIHAIVINMSILTTQLVAIIINVP